MKFKVIATGSAANAYVLNDSAGNCIIIEAGVGREKINVNLPDNFRVESSICIVSHAHGDHAHYADSLKPYFPVYKAWEFQTGRIYESDVWKVSTFEVQHSIQNHGFAILNKTENKKILFITDFYAIEPVILDSLYLTKFDLCAIECNFNNFLLHKETDSARREASLNHCSDDYFIEVCGKIRQRETAFVAIHGSAHFLSQTMLNAKWLKKFSNYLEIAKAGTNLEF